METLKALIVGDLHCHPHSGSWRHVDDALEAFSWALDVYEQEGCNHLFFLGDWQQKKAIIHTVIENRSREILEFAASRGIRMTIIPGNHDCPFINDPDHSYGWVSSSVAHVILKPYVYRYEDVDVYAVPFFGPADRMRDIVDSVIQKKKEVSNDRRAIFLGHLDILGGLQSNSHRAEYGLTPKILSENFAMSFLGHYHVRDRIHEKILYVGSLLTTKFNEEGQRGVTVWEKREYRFIPNTISPQHMTIDPEQVNEERANGNFVRVRIQQNTDTKDIERRLRELGALKIVLLPTTDDGLCDEESTGITVLERPSSELTERAILSRWVKDSCPSDLDPEQLYKAGEDILAKVGL